MARKRAFASVSSLRSSMSASASRAGTSRWGGSVFGGWSGKASHLRDGASTVPGLDADGNDVGSVVSGYITTAGQWPPKEEPSNNRMFGGKLSRSMAGKKVRVTKGDQAEMFADAFPTEDRPPPKRIRDATASQVMITRQASAQQLQLEAVCEIGRVACLDLELTLRHFQ